MKRGKWKRESDVTLRPAGQADGGSKTLAAHGDAGAGDAVEAVDAVDTVDVEDDGAVVGAGAGVEDGVGGGVGVNDDVDDDADGDAYGGADGALDSGYDADVRMEKGAHWYCAGAARADAPRWADPTPQQGCDFGCGCDCGCGGRSPYLGPSRDVHPPVTAAAAAAVVGGSGVPPTQPRVSGQT